MRRINLFFCPRRGFCPLFVGGCGDSLFRVPFFACDALPFVEPCAALVDFGEGEDGTYKPRTRFGVDKIDVAQLKALDVLCSELPPIGRTALHMGDAEVAAGLADLRIVGTGCDRCYGDRCSVGQEHDRFVGVDLREHEVAGAIDRAVATLRTVGKGNHPLDVRGLFAYHAQGLADAVAFGISGEVVVEGHAIEFDETIPRCAFYERDDLLLVERWAILQHSVERAVEERSEMKL